MRTFLIGFFILFYLPTFAANKEVVQSLLDKLSPDSKILKIEQTNVFRCSGCFEFAVTFEKSGVSNVDYMLYYRTRKNITSGEYEVERVD